MHLARVTALRTPATCQAKRRHPSQRRGRSVGRRLEEEAKAESLGQIECNRAARSDNVTDLAHKFNGMHREKVYTFLVYGLTFSKRYQRGRAEGEQARSISRFGFTTRVWRAGGGSRHRYANEEASNAMINPPA
ncbi:Protein of unknown function [Gryllus bimaculatus]|nr:Protein of unknown function [Gryllus bimaculatus]